MSEREFPAGTTHWRGPKWRWWLRGVVTVLRSHPEISNPRRLRRVLFHAVFFRIVIALLLLLGTLWSVIAQGGSPAKEMLIYLSLGVMVGVSLLNALWLRWSKHLALLGYSQLLFDVLLASVIVYVTGETGSPFIFLYLLIILEATVIFGRHGSVIVAAASGVSYGVLLSGQLPTFESVVIPASGLQIFSVYTALVVIALLSSYFAKQLEIAGRMIDRYAKDLHDLCNQQQQVFDDLREGIITCDLDSLITNVNQAARKLLNLTDDAAKNLLGRPFQSLFDPYFTGGEDSPKEPHFTMNTASELELTRRVDSRRFHLSYSFRPLTDSNGVETGQILILNDVSRMRSMEELLSQHEKTAQLMAKERSLSMIPVDLSGIQMVGESVLMKQIFSLVDRVAKSDASVLITGESGTGKELIAKALHEHGPRKSRPFVAINCGAIPENLIESELFGHKKGSFTGAVTENLGLFRQADGGTIFLDEVGELPLHLQTKLLRVLQEKTVRAVGGVSDTSVDVRVISATNKYLKQEIKENRFREDLYYRLNVVNIVVPPLRNRREDIPYLVRYFISRSVDDSDVQARVSPEALQMLMAYSFPGNVRELENIIERAIVLGSGVLLPENLPEEVQHKLEPTNGTRGDERAVTDVQILPVDLEGILASLERKYLFEALNKTHGAKKQAAELLGLNFRSFRYRLKKYGMGDADSADER